ncbi:MAG: hypothetical protein LZ172_03485 [Thaumarchaeota archaeon]|jgi:hypothetical protein|nr:hypothetical protein [Candidatus Geocrenenecus arthurdayi]MCL7402498.1 hypothetical protein [Candidatus Geocrenenecus arthurdayi]MCL7403394.1 hypothetical protein [Candidatus Geocrenenecus arthurdayi]
MSSLGSIIVFIIFTITTLILVGYMLNSLSNYVSLFTYYSQYLEGSLQENRGEIIIKELEVSPDNITVTSRLMNKCSKPIRVRDFPLIDIILVYRTLNDKIRVKWLPHNLDRTLNEGWRPLEIEQTNNTELINPASGDFKSGLWDPGEVLLLEAWVMGDEPIIGDPVLIVSCLETGGRN